MRLGPLTVHAVWVFDWPEWFRPGGYNWLNFRLANIAVERQEYIREGQAEITLILLGLGAELTVYRTNARKGRALLKAERLRREFLDQKAEPRDGD